MYSIVHESFDFAWKITRINIFWEENCTSSLHIVEKLHGELIKHQP